MIKPILPVIIGPTASGKTHLAVNLAKEFEGEIISADSRQVYRQMDIGTGKDIDEYTIKGHKIPYHLIDICAPGDKYNINLFYNDFVNAFEAIKAKKSLPILCGGSGLYVQTALEGNELSSIPINNELREEFNALSKEILKFKFSKINITLQKKLDNTSKKRLIRALEINEYLKSYPYPKLKKPHLNPMLFGLDIPREERRKKISNRLKKRLEHGMIDEVIMLKQKTSNECLKYYGLEYLFITEYLEKKYDKAELFRRLEIAIHQFGKRQMTWFRKMEKDGYKINWIKYDLPVEEKLEIVKEGLTFNK